MKLSRRHFSQPFQFSSALQPFQFHPRFRRNCSMLFGRRHESLPSKAPWPASIGTGGRLRAESPADFVGMRKLGEHAQHLKHRLSGRCSGVEALLMQE